MKASFFASRGFMKSAEEFYVLPEKDGSIYVESNNYVGRFDKFGNGIWLKKGNKRPQPIKFEPMFVQEAMQVCPPLGFDNIVLELFK